MRRFLVPGLGEAGARIRLDGDAAHHAVHVLRMPDGAPVRIFDGHGLEAFATLRIEPAGVFVVQLATATPSRPWREVHLVLGLPKPPATDTAVRMATEAGVTHIHLVLCARSVRRDCKLERLARVAREAARQCGRADAPELSEHASLQAALDLVPPDRWVAVPGGNRPAAGAQPTAVLVGPEGGFTDDELERALDSGCVPLGLGAWTLRSETAAALAVGALAAPEPGGVGPPTSPSDPASDRL